MEKKPIILIVALSLIGLALPGQSLLEDAHRLVAAKKQLLQQPSQLDTLGIKRSEAYAEMLAILQLYDAKFDAPSPSAAQLQALPQRYSGNALLSDWLPFKALSDASQALDSLTLAAYRSKDALLQHAPRQRITQLMKGVYGGSPAEYLSVSRSLQRYSVPPVESRVQLQVAAEESNQNIQAGLVNTQALLEGVFRFVLERAQQEVAVNFMDRFLEDDLPPVKVLFPTVFEQVSSTGFSYSHSYLDRIRTAFYEDLQLLSVRLPVILLDDERFQSLQADPLLYNLLTVYTIVGMAQQDMPPEEIIAITHRTIYENYGEQEKALNLALAKNGQEQAGYQELVGQARAVVNQLVGIYLSLNEAEFVLEDSLQAITARSGAPEVPAFDNLFQPAYQLDALLGESSDEDPYRLNFLPFLLEGRLDSAYLMGLRELASYDRYFAEDHTPEEYRAAGLELARKLNGTWYGEQTLLSLLRDWAADLQQYHRSLNDWKYEVLPGELQAAVYGQLENRRQALKASIAQARAYWAGRDSLSYQQGLAFGVLANIVADQYDPNSPAVRVRRLKDPALTPLALLREWEEKLNGAESRFLALNRRIAGDSVSFPPAHPVQMYLMSQETATPYAGILLQINTLQEQLQGLSRQLEDIDRQHAALEKKLLRNAEPMLFLTESLSHLMYCLRSASPDHYWVQPAEVDSALNDPELRPAFLGLMYQRMQQVRHSGRISPDGLAQLVQLTVQDLPKLEVAADTASARDSLAFFRKASFVVRTLNRVLELPLLASPSGRLEPLTAQRPALSGIPAVADKALDLVFYLNQKDHQQAIGATLGLFSAVLPALQNDQAGQQEMGRFLTFLNEYGYFVAGLVDAKTSYEVQSLLEGISDPPGSSRLKRKKKVTVAVNAYLGATAGQETWSRTSTGEEETFENIMPTMPIGFSISRRLGKPRTRIFEDASRPPKQVGGHSATLFLGLLDLGSLFSYVPGDTAFGDTELTFKNVFKPSAQLHYNFPKVPFYAGVGAQYGPHFRDMDGEQLSLQSTRFFISLGVDVPIKTLFVR